MKRILVPLDGSALAEAILPVAAELAREHEADVVLLEVVATAGSASAETRAQAEAYLGAVAGRLAARGLARVRTEVWYGEPDQAIANAAAHGGAGLVAMSTHGRGGLSRLRFGSVAERVVRKATVPVLLVRGEAAWGPGGIGRILVPLDGSALSEGILPVVADLAGPFDFTVQLLRVVEAVAPSQAGEAVRRDEERRARAEAEDYLGRTAAPLEARGLRVSRAVRFGSPVEVVQQVAAEEGSGLIAMSTHGRTGLDRLLLGSVAERVLRSVPVPVLLWKAHARGGVLTPGTRRDDRMMGDGPPRGAGQTDEEESTWPRRA